MNTEERLERVIIALRPYEKKISHRVRHVLELIDHKLDGDALKTFQEWEKIVKQVEVVQKKAITLAKNAHKGTIIDTLVDEIKDEESLRELLRSLLKHPDHTIASTTEKVLHHLEEEYVESKNFFSEAA